MAIEAVTALAAKEIGVQAAREAAMQAAREIAQKMAAEAGAQGAGREVQTAMMEHQSMQEGFRIGEMPEKSEDREILKQREVDVAAELQEKLHPEGTEVKPSDAHSDAETQQGDIETQKGDIQNPGQSESQKDIGTQENTQVGEGADSRKDVNDETEQKLKSDYLDDLQNRSEVPDTIDKDKAMEENYEKQTVEETQARRNEFNNSKSELIKKWEEENGRPWPRYEEDVYHNGNRIRKAGDLYDCHHIQPLGHGGKNEVSNITPMHALEHYDRQGIHAGDSPYAKLDNYLKEKELA